MQEAKRAHNTVKGVIRAIEIFGIALAEIDFRVTRSCTLYHGAGEIERLHFSAESCGARGQMTRSRCDFE